MITLTGAGRELLRLARRITDHAANLKENARRASIAQIGRLRLATQLSFMGPRLRSRIERFRSFHLGVALQLAEVSDCEAIDVHDRTPLRAEPQARGLLLRVIYPDQLLQVIDERGDWVEVGAFNYSTDAPIRGWVSRRRLRLTPQR